jgi:uncharacterized protein
MRGTVAFVAGVVFAVGLALSGMTRPSKVLGFLDVFGAWDPSLAFVMVGAIGVHFVARRLVIRRSKPLLDKTFESVRQGSLDRNLLLGAAIFGVGWGLGGYCPGPAIVTAGSGMLPAIVFVCAMAAGMVLERLLVKDSA